jgi:hypothetical protein
MTNTYMTLFDRSGILLPIKDEHMFCPPNPFKYRSYAQMPLQQLTKVCKDGNTNIDMFMELYRHASAQVFRAKSRFYWDCVPVDFTRGEENLQLQRARIIMTYDAKWKTGRAPTNLSITYLGTQDQRVEPAYYAVRRDMNAVEARYAAEARLRPSTSERVAPPEEDNSWGNQKRKLTIRNPDQT